MSAESAEITKLALNCFITTKIAYANTVADIASRTPNANAVDILKAGKNAAKVACHSLIYSPLSRSGLARWKQMSLPRLWIWRPVLSTRQSSSWQLCQVHWSQSYHPM